MKIKLTILVLVLIGLTGCSVYNENFGSAMEITAADRVLDFNGKEFNTWFTDDNTGEELLIYSDKEYYSGFREVTSVISIQNTTNNDETVKIEIISDDIEEVISIKEAKEDIEYQKEIDDYDDDDKYIRTRIVIEKVDEWHKLVDDNYTLPANSISFFEVKMRVALNAKGKFNVKASNKDVYGFLDPWFDTDWGFKQKLTINNSEVSTTSDAFIVTVTSTQAVLKTTGNGGNVELASGDDIIFVNSAEDAILNFEQEKYVETTGELVYHIQTPVSSTTDQDIYMYYGNSGASDQATTTGVWLDTDKAVWHLPDTNDSTKFGNNGTANFNASSTANSQHTGQLGEGFLFDGTGDNITLTLDASLNFQQNLAISAWINPTVSQGRIVHRGRNSLANNGKQYDIGFTANTAIFVVADDSAHDRIDTAASIPLDTWTYIVCRVDSADVMACFINGVEDSDTLTRTLSDNLSFAVGQRIGSHRSNSGDSNYFFGIADEIRISNISITDADILTTYNNQVAVQEFFTFGAEEEVPAAGTPEEDLKIKDSRIKIDNSNIKIKSN